MKKFIKSLAVISAIFLALGGFISCSNGSDDDPVVVPPTGGTTPPAPTTTAVNNLKVAPLVDHSDASEVTEGLVDKDSYTYSAYYNNVDSNTVYVTIKAKDLVLHENANKAKGYWVGIAIPKNGNKNWFWRAGEDKAPESSATFSEQTRTWKPDESETEYNTFYYCPDDGDFTGKKVYIQLAESAESGVKKTYVITFNVTTKKPYEIGYIKGSGTAGTESTYTGYVLEESDYPTDIKTKSGWMNDTVWVKFSNVEGLSGKYIWAKFDAGDGKELAINLSTSDVATTHYYAMSFLNNTQWEYRATKTKDNLKDGADKSDKDGANYKADYEGTYTVWVYAFDSEQTAPTDSNSFKTFGSTGTLIGISKIKVEKSDATKAAENKTE